MRKIPREEATEDIIKRTAAEILGQNVACAYVMPYTGHGRGFELAIPGHLSAEKQARLYQHMSKKFNFPIRFKHVYAPMVEP